MKALSLDEYRVLELHQYQIEQYIHSYLYIATDKKNGGFEPGSRSKKSIEKYNRLKQYLQKLSNYLHKQSRLVFPLLNDPYNGETI